MEQQQQLNTAFSAELQEEDAATAAAPSPSPPPPTPPPSELPSQAQMQNGILSYDSEASSSYFDSAFHDALPTGPQADLEPNPETESGNRVAPDLPSIQEETEAVPASQSVVVVDDKGRW